MAEPARDQLYTYEDYLTWDGQYELIDGVPYPKYGSHPYEKPSAMAGVSLSHHDVHSELFMLFKIFLKGKTCKLYSNNFDVIFREKGKKKDTTLQPDLFVVCDPSKVDDKGCHGAPDLVIEILSPTTSYKDRGEKLHKYEYLGVLEYWIVDPFNKYVTVYILNDGKYGLAAATYEQNETIPVHVLEGCNIDLQSVFENIQI